MPCSLPTKPELVREAAPARSLAEIDSTSALGIPHDKIAAAREDDIEKCNSSDGGEPGGWLAGCSAPWRRSRPTTSVYTQGGGGQQQPPPTETEAPDIPGVVKGGTKVQVIKAGFQGTEGPIGMPDGSLIFTETQANRITRIAADGTTSTFLENTNGANGLAFDAKGRLLSVQTTPGQTKIGVLYPKGSEATITDNFEGKAYGRPNDLVVSTKAQSISLNPARTRQRRGRRHRRHHRCHRRSITWHLARPARSKSRKASNVRTASC